MESIGAIGIHGDDGEVKATRHRQHTMEAADRMRAVAVRRVVLRPLGHPGGRVTPLARGLSYPASRGISYPDDPASRGISYPKDTAFSFFHLGGRGNNSNLACQYP